MNDDRPSPADPGNARAQRADLPTGEIVTQAELDDVLNDPRLSAAEREARLADLRQRILDNEHVDGDEQYAPLQMRIMDALSMVAEGGHDYDGSLRVEAEEVEAEENGDETVAPSPLRRERD